MEKKKINQDKFSTNKNTKRKLVWNIIFLIAAIVYTISPMDIIPDFLGPLGFIDDIFLWVVIVGFEVFKRLYKKQNNKES